MISYKKKHVFALTKGGNWRKTAFLADIKLTDETKRFFDRLLKILVTAHFLRRSVRFKEKKMYSPKEEFEKNCVSSRYKVAFLLANFEKGQTKQSGLLIELRSRSDHIISQTDDIITIERLTQIKISTIYFWSKYANTRPRKNKTLKHAGCITDWIYGLFFIRVLL